MNTDRKTQPAWSFSRYLRWAALSRTILLTFFLGIFSLIVFGWWMSTQTEDSFGVSTEGFAEVVEELDSDEVDLPKRIVFVLNIFLCAVHHFVFGRRLLSFAFESLSLLLCFIFSHF